jgi:putative ABC transport system substrate-binding protein
VLVNPANRQSAESTLTEEAAHSLRLQAQVLNASTSREIDAAFATLARDRTDALLVAADGFFTSRRVQLANLAARERVPTAYSQREFVAVGGLMSYRTNIVESWQQAGTYTGNILKGAKPGDLPVVQSTKFELLINLHTARLLDLDVPPSFLAIADGVIEQFLVMTGFGTSRSPPTTPQSRGFSRYRGGPDMRRHPLDRRRSG